MGTAGIPSLGNVAKGLLKRALCQVRGQAADLQGGVCMCDDQLLQSWHGCISSCNLHKRAHPAATVHPPSLLPPPCHSS